MPCKNMTMNKNVKSCKLYRPRGFTLTEVLIALAILIIGILSGFILVTKVLYNVVVVQDRLTASFLAQEGIEAVRQIRDTNFLRILNGESINWDEGLAPGNYIIKTKIGSASLPELASASDIPVLLYDDLRRIYNYDDGETTTFQREIKITDVNENEIRVESIMSWRTKNVDFDLTVEDHLYNWMQL